MRAAIPFLRVRLWTTNWSCRPRNQPNIEVFATLANIKLPHPQHNIKHVHKRLWTSAYPNFKVVASHSDTNVYRNNIPSARSVLSPKHAVELLSWQLNRIYFNPAKGMVLVAETCWLCSSFEVMYITYVFKRLPLPRSWIGVNTWAYGAGLASHYVTMVHSLFDPTNCQCDPEIRLLDSSGLIACIWYVHILYIYSMCTYIYIYVHHIMCAYIHIIFHVYIYIYV